MRTHFRKASIFWTLGFVGLRSSVSERTLGGFLIFRFSLFERECLFDGIFGSDCLGVSFFPRVFQTLLYLYALSNFILIVVFDCIMEWHE